MSEFERFGLATTKPAWSSAVLEQAIDRALEEGSAADLLESVHALLARSDLTATHAHFVRDFGAVLLRKGGSGAWKPRSIATPGQALLAVYVLPDDRFTPELLLEILSQLAPTDMFDHSVRQLQDLLLRPETARMLFAAKPELAKRVRAALTN
jgi:hypothetical protein